MSLVQWIVAVCLLLVVGHLYNPFEKLIEVLPLKNKYDALTERLESTLSPRNYLEILKLLRREEEKTGSRSASSYWNTLERIKDLEKLQMLAEQYIKERIDLKNVYVGDGTRQALQAVEAGRMTEDNAALILLNNVASYAGAYGGGFVGATIGSAIGGPIGGVVGGLVGGIAGGSFAKRVISYLEYYIRRLFNLPKDNRIDEAYQGLGLDRYASDGEVAHRIRHCQGRNHPDRGGNKDEFVMCGVYGTIIKEHRGAFY